MSKRHYDYAGRCTDCERTVETRIAVHGRTSRPDPVQWCRCRECGEILSIQKVSAEAAMTDWETTV